MNEQLRKLEENFNIEVEKQKNERKEQADNWIKQADSRLLTICHSMEDLTNEKGQTVEMITDRMKKKILNLEEIIDNQRKIRENNANKLSEEV